MPSSAEILRSLHVEASELAWLSIAWHAAILVGTVAVLAGWRPTRRTGALLLVAPAASVSAAAFAYGNPFNGSSFAVLAVALAIAAARLRTAAFEASPPWARVMGGALVLYGACYPAFTAQPWYRSLYAAPVGVVPCPTLATMAGAALLGGGFGSRALPALLALWTAFYAVFGIVRLGVFIDAGLLLASLGLLLLIIHNRFGLHPPAERHAGARDHRGA